MQRRPERPDHAAWFVYSRRPSKISAVPVNVRGWIALAGCIAMTVLASRAVFGWARALHPVAGFLASTAVVIAGFGMTIVLAVRKGRPVD